MLVFRDGHQEEISRYTIVGGNIYTSADYWNSGSWTKKVPLAELDVPSTLQLNRERDRAISSVASFVSRTILWFGRYCRSGRNAARSSALNSSGCSHAAK